MKLSAETKIHELLGMYPFLLEFLAGYNPKFALLRNKAMRATMGRMASLSMVAAMGNMPLNILLKDLAEEIKKHTGEKIEISFSQPAITGEEKKERLKEIIRDLHEGKDFAEVKKSFDLLMEKIEPTEIAALEEQLIREGMPAEEIQRLCDLHVSLFKGALESQGPVNAPPGHPVHTYMAENEVFSGIIMEFNSLIARLGENRSTDNYSCLKDAFKETLAKLARIEIHYQRKENQLFPFLEKHGITGPSQVMWGIHDEVRGYLKEAAKAIEKADLSAIIDIGARLTRTMVEMIYKENSILFPMALETLEKKEWLEIRRGEDEIGYVFVTPGTEWGREDEGLGKAEGTHIAELLNLDTGALTREQVNFILTHLPVEISFVDENDQVRFYSETPERIFPRSPGVIGRKVQNCHPPKSLHVVQRILDAFRSGEKDSADFWIQSKGKFILIRYFAVRDKEGHYKGTIEVTQDITAIHALEGERRLLDWEK